MAPKLGKVKLLSCIDFVTYSSFTFQATEYLNIILGPNGTGKSTVIAAIFLGLGGEPKFLGRSTNLADFVRNGGNQAEITIELYADNEGTTTCTFQRKFDRSNVCQCFINKRKVSKAAYLEKIATYNVQINNLCQFLPQDRLHEFASMNAQELFANTLLAVQTQFYDELQQLKEMRKAQLEQSNVVKQKGETVQQLKARIESLQESMARYNTIQMYIKQVKICNAKLMWIDVAAIAEQLEQLNLDVNKAKKNVTTKNNAYQSSLKAQRNIALVTQELESELTKQKRLLETADNRFEQAQHNIDELQKDITAEQHNFELRKRRMKERSTEIKNCEELATVHEDDYKNLQATLDAELQQTDEEKLDRDLNAHRCEIKHQTDLRANISMSLDTEILPAMAKLKAHLEKMNNVNEQKLEFLRRRAPDVITAIDWLRSNKQRFESKVYDPVFMELSVPDANDIKYVENTIPLRDLLAFTCESKEDMSILTNELCVKQKLSVNVVYSPPSKGLRYRSKQPIDNLSRFGFKAYLLDLVEAPSVILNSLCGLFNLHNIPVSNDIVLCEPEDLVGIGQYFGGDYRFNVSTSMYTQKKSVMQTFIKPHNILGRGDFAKERQPLEQSMATLVRKADARRNERTNIEAKINRLKHECEELIKKRSYLQTCKNRLESLMVMAQRKRQEAERLRKEIAEITDDENVVKAKIKQKCQEIQKINEKQYESLKIYQQAAAQLELVEFLLSKHKYNSKEIEEGVRDKQKQLKEAENLLETIISTKRRKQREHDEQMQELLKLTEGVNPTDRNYADYTFFAELPDDEVELQAKINEFTARAELMDGDYNGIFEQYERETKKLQQMEEHINKAENERTNCTAQINALYVPWFANINAIVGTINSTFQSYTEKMGFLGGVYLQRGEHYDFDSYGLLIMVSFRANGELQALDRTVQSGGERSLCIAVYTLSLQQMTHVPFRCVDEVNQGMDSTNERKVFDMLLKETTRDESSQYFFVTPKLLPNLPFNARMSVHIIYNGLFMDQNVFMTV